MPYRVDLPRADGDVFDRLVDLGALDIERLPDGTLAALMPDPVTPGQVEAASGCHRVVVSPAVGRDADSVWVLSPRSTRIGSLEIVPAEASTGEGALRLIDASVFGTGLHPTTALCLEALTERMATAVPAAMLDIGTGSGVLALAALKLGVPRALAIDIDDDALRVARANAALNRLDDRIEFLRGGPAQVTGAWPLAVANVLAAPLMEVAPGLVQRIGHRGQLLLSGIPAAVEPDVSRVYRAHGMHHLNTTMRGGWVALLLEASW